MAGETPRQLKQTTTGRIFPYTETLRRRPDMIEWPQKITAGITEPGQQTQIVQLKYGNRTFMIDKDSVDNLNALISENERLKFEMNQMKAKRPKDVVPESTPNPRTAPEQQSPPGETSVPEQLTPEQRIAKIEEAIELMVEAGDQDNFAQSGLPKVQAIEGLCGLSITAAERDKAWEMSQAKK